MDRGAWQATVHESQRVGNDLATKQPQRGVIYVIFGLFASLVAQMGRHLPGIEPGSGSSHGKENSNPLPYPCLENFMDRGAR